MATIIDALLVTLGLDASQFKKGAKEVEKEQDHLTKQAKRDSKERETIDRKRADAEKKRAKELQHQQKQTAESFSKIRNQVLSLAAVFTGGMGVLDFIRDTVTSSAALGRLSQNVGVSVNELAGWGLAAKNVGSSAEEMNAQFLKAAQTVGAYKMGTPTAELEAFYKYGGSANPKTFENAKSFLLAQSALLEHWNKVDPGRALIVASQMGISPAQFNLLKQGPQAIEAMVSADSRLAGMTNAQARASQALIVRWNAFTSSLANTGRVIMFELMPAFNIVLAEVQKLAKWIGQHPQNIRKWATDAVLAVKELAQAINATASAINTLNDAANKIKPIKSAFIENLPGVRQFHFAETLIHFINGKEHEHRLPGPVGAAAGRAVPAASQTNVSAETRIQQINIVTQAHDAKEIAGSIGPAIRQQNLALQANAGLN